MTRHSLLLLLSSVVASFLAALLLLPLLAGSPAEPVASTSALAGLNRC